MAVRIPLVSVLAVALLAAACSRTPARQQERGGPVPPSAEPSPVPAAAPAALPSDEERARGVAALRRGQELARAGDARGAERVFQEAARTLPAFRGWAHLLAAEAAAGTGDTAATRRLVESAGDTVALERGWRVLAGALQRSGDTVGAARAVAAAAPAVPSRTGRAEAWRALGDLRLRAGDPAGALDAFRRALQSAPGSQAGLGAARAASELPGLLPEDRLRVGRALLEHGGTERGVAGIEAYLGAGRGTPAERAQLHLEAGRALFAARRHAAAETHLLQAAPTLGEAAVLAGRAQIRQGREDRARTTLRSAAARFAGREAAAEALLLLGELEQDAGRSGAAREWYRQAVAAGAHGPAAGEAALRLGALGVLAGDPRGALRDLEAYLAGRGRDTLAVPALYWAGRAHLLAGDGEAATRRFREAREAHPFSYYGVRAAERLGGSLEGAPLADAPRVDPGAEARVRAALFRSDVLREIGREEEAGWEIDRLREGVDDDPAALYLVAEGMAERGRPVAAQLLAQEIRKRRGAWDERLLRIAYPFRYRELVEREARRHGLDPFLVAGLIRRESFFNPNAVSPAGAVGLMQVMPETGRGLARGAGITGFTPSMLRDPETNVRLGTRFLAAQVRRYRTLTEVFAAYNAGPGRVARWRSFPEYRDEDLFVERIPFEETRTYVKRVRTYTHVYRSLYAD